MPVKNTGAALLSTTLEKPSDPAVYAPGFGLRSERACDEPSASKSSE
jgi:hypothetical protein